jgi:methyltransferase-like protein/predicted O-methyltransferase YrrM
MQQADIATYYDQIPYPRLAYHYTHPDRMAVLGRLFGMHPQPVEKCRVLELGCAAGANLVPMAYTLPHTEFVGIDLSSTQINDARALANAAGLNNLRLEQLDVRELDESFGTFDYIIAHGLYSWIPESVQARVLDVCAKMLSPQGIAYVSYNAFPGGHLRRMLRGMAMYHVRDTDNPREIVGQVRGLIEFLAAMAMPVDSPYALVLRDLKQTVAQMSDSGLMHEFLEPDNLPVLFHDFIRDAEAAGLQYLTEVTFADRAELNVAADVLDQLRQQHGEIGSEQYLDFLNGQSFRRTLLCRRDVALDRDVSGVQVEGFLVASSAQSSASQSDLTSDRTVRFTTLHGVSTASNRPAFKVALAALSECYPQAIPIPQLCQRVGERLGRTLTGNEVASLRGELLGRFMMEKEVVEFRLYQPALTHEAGAQPLASPVARSQAERGWPVASLTHKMAPLSDSRMALLLQHLDGEHTWDQLAEFLAPANVGGAATADSEQLQGLLSTTLAHFAHIGLLVR